MKKNRFYLVSILTIVILFALSTSNRAVCQENPEISVDDLMFDPQYYDDLDKALANKENVKYLDIAMQKRNSIPSSVFSFPNMERLYLGFNPFSSLPKEIGNLQNLKYLDLSGCYTLYTVPDALGKLTNLKEVRMKDMMKTDVQKKLVARVKELLPNCNVVSDFGDVKPGDGR